MTGVKMGDVFAMNTTLENSTGEGFLLKDNNCEYEEEYLAIIFDSNQARAITRAINNHDRLTEENAQLKADNSELVNLLREARESGVWHRNLMKLL